MQKQGFTFKQFHIEQDRCAMKVGTDGVLLGAWADIHQAKQILDLGTGTGLIALMLAQRSHPQSKIVAVELDQNAYEQAQHNIHRSLWQHKIQIFQDDVMAFCQYTQMKFDLIVANPPYFATGVPCATTQRQLARYTVQQCHLDWLNAAQDCLAAQGQIQFILPFEAGEILQKQTALYCIKRTEVITKKGKAPQRILLSFAFDYQPLQHNQLIIYDENNQYHADFIRLTKDFYLHF